MPRVSTIESHPKRRDIEKALIEHQSYRDIARRFDIKKDSLVRHHDKFAEKFAKAVEKREIADGENIYDSVLAVIDKVGMLIEACHEYLQDPDDPSKYNLHARDEDVIVSVQAKYEKDEMPGPRMRMSLQEALEQIEDKGYIVHSARYSHADPRKLILEAAKTLEGQHQFLLNMSAELRAIRQEDITKHPEYQKFEKMLAEVLAPYPEALEALQRAAPH